MVSLFPEELADFLRKPRNAGEVASHFGIPERVAASHLKRGLTEGKILIAGFSLPTRGTRVDLHLKQMAKTLYVSREIRPFFEGVFKLTPRIDARLSTRDRKISTPKFRLNTANLPPTTGKADRIAKPSIWRSKTRLVSGSYKAQTNQQARKAHRVYLGPSDLLRILLHVREHPASISETREALAISGAELKRLIRVGLLRESWGRGGVGVTIRLSKEGLRQLRWMQEASKLDSQSRRGLFVRMRNKLAPF